MRFKQPYLLQFLLTLIVSTPLYASCVVTDGLNHTIQLKKPAKRIVSLAPNVTEILFSIGAGNQIIGAVQGSDYPLEARKIHRIGTYTAINVEKLMAMHPDLIIAWGDTYSRQLTTLRKLGVPIYTPNPQQLEDIPLIMKNLGCLCGVNGKAIREADDFSYKLDKMRKQYANQKPLTVFFQTNPYSSYTIHKNSWINQVIAVCGGRNIFAQTKLPYDRISLESIVIANPEVIISEAPGQAWKKRWQTEEDISAVKNNLLFTIDPNLIEQASPRILKGTEKICKYLQSARAGKAALMAQKTKMGSKVVV